MARHGSLRWRRCFIAIAILMIVVAAGLWLEDGAWKYSAMPTKGVIRTALFGGIGCLCLAAAGWLTAKPG